MRKETLLVRQDRGGVPPWERTGRVLASGTRGRATSAPRAFARTSRSACQALPLRLQCLPAAQTVRIFCIQRDIRLLQLPLACKTILLLFSGRLQRRRQCNGAISSEFYAGPHPRNGKKKGGVHGPHLPSAWPGRPTGVGCPGVSGDAPSLARGRTLRRSTEGSAEDWAPAVRLLTPRCVRMTHAAGDGRQCEVTWKMWAI